MFETNTKAVDPEKEKLEKKRNELSSRYHSLSYASDDYDRKKGKNSFSKKFPDAHKLMNDLLDQKTRMDIHLATYQKTDPNEATESKDILVPVI